MSSPIQSFEIVFKVLRCFCCKLSGPLKIPHKHRGTQTGQAHRASPTGAKAPLRERSTRPYLQDMGVDAQRRRDVSRSRHCLQLLCHAVLHCRLLGRLLGDVCHVTVQLQHSAHLLHLGALRIQAQGWHQTTTDSNSSLRKRP